MNDIAKESIKTKLETAIETENLLNQDVAAIFDMHPAYISWFKNPKYWDKIRDKFWDRVLCWVNSGQSLKEYSEKHGKVLCDKSVKIVSGEKPINASDIKSDPKLIKEAARMQRKEERISRGTFIDLLLEEKRMLRIKIDAIDVLLKSYME